MMLVLGVAVVFMALLVAEYGGRVVVGRVAQNQLQSQGIADAQVTVGRSWWRPTLLPAVLGGGLDRVSVQLRDAEVSGVLVETRRLRPGGPRCRPGPVRRVARGHLGR